MEKGDEELQNKLIREQVERAQQQQQRDRAAGNGETSAVPEELHRVDGESRITLDFGSGKQQHHQSQEALKPQVPNVDGQEAAETDLAMQPTIADTEPKPATASSSPPLPSSSSSSKPKNVFAAKKSVFASKKNLPVKEPARKMSEAERIMRGELERKRARHGPSAMADGSKRVKVL